MLRARFRQRNIRREEDLGWASIPLELGDRSWLFNPREFFYCLQIKASSFEGLSFKSVSLLLAWFLSLLLLNFIEEHGIDKVVVDCL